MERTHPFFIRSIGFLILAVSPCVSTPTAPAQSLVTIAPKPGACEPAVVDEAMEVSSLPLFEARASDDVKNVVTALESGGRRLAPAIRAKVLQAFDQAFDPGAMDEEFRRGIRSHCEPKIFAVALARMKTPLGVKMRKLEDFMLTPQGRSAYLGYVRNMQLHPPTAQREALLDRMENVEHATDFLADVNAEEARAMYIGISGKSASDAEAQALREKIMPAMRQAVRTSALFAYRNTSDDELEQYIAMLEAAEMRRFQTIVKNVFENGMIRRSEVAAAIIQQAAAGARGGRPQ